MLLERWCNLAFAEKPSILRNFLVLKEQHPFGSLLYLGTPCIPVYVQNQFQIKFQIIQISKQQLPLLNWYRLEFNNS